MHTPMPSASYVNAKYHYRIEYPSEWNVRPENVLEQDMPKIDLATAQYVGLAGPRIVIQISVDENPHGLSASAFYEQRHANRLYAATSGMQAQTSSSTVGSFAALKEEIRTAKGEICGVNYYFEKDDLIFCIGIVPNGSSFLSGEDANQAQPVLQSFNFQG
jgi:hypothetical protein